MQGQLYTKAPLDYELSQFDGFYSVTLRVEDPSGSGVNQRVEINVENVDEPGIVTLLPSDPEVGSNLAASLSDPDVIDIHVPVSWEWQRSIDKNDWATIGSGSLYKPTKADEGYWLKAVASYADGEGPNKSAETITDSAVPSEANSAPAFPRSETGVRSVDENTRLFAN